MHRSRFWTFADKTSSGAVAWPSVCTICQFRFTTKTNMSSIQDILKDAIQGASVSNAGQMISNRSVKIIALGLRPFKAIKDEGLRELIEVALAKPDYQHDKA